MDDMVTLLRWATSNVLYGPPTAVALVGQAADEIERLRKENNRLLQGHASLCDQVEQLQAENARLRGVYNRAAETWPAGHVMPPLVQEWWKKLYEGMVNSPTAAS